LVAPEPITSSEVIENVSVDGAVVATGTAGNLPVVWVAQGTFLLLTIMLTSLWWRSRTARGHKRPN
jgi:membrane protein implicated in regulation of membrane protease activity